MKNKGKILIQFFPATKGEMEIALKELKKAGFEGYLIEDEFEDKRKALVSQLSKLQDLIHAVDDYRPIQNELARIVNEIRPIEYGYASRIYDCSQEIQKTLGSNVAWAAISMATLGLVKKPEK